MTLSVFFVPKDVADNLVRIGAWTEQDREAHDKSWQDWADEVDRRILEELLK
jgi:hypothetical protein